MVEDVLIEKLNVTNVCKFANAAVAYNAKTLEEHCICFIIDAAKESKPIFDALVLRNAIKTQICERMLFSSSNRVA